ncbi:MAG: translation initiation factor IF-3 [bacterium]|nr:translation initiation factor IF-3 [Clostridia bacterium]MCR5553308.1 translation initiation factor IF-3 [bacterium]
MIKQEAQLNQQITDLEVRVIGPDGAMLGIMSAKEANRLADEAELDLVKISPNANPPVCRIMDYGKYKFDQMKREKEQRKNQKVIELKEVQLSMTIEMHDIEIKAKNAIKFLTQGNRVKVSLRMRGRQQAYSAHGIEICNQFFGLVENYAVIEKEAKVEGRNILMFLAPKPAK